MRQAGKTIASIQATKLAQMQGKTVLWYTVDQAATARLLARHGALSLVVGDNFLKPVFRKNRT